MADFKIGVTAGSLITLPDPDSDGPDNSPQWIGGTHTSLGGSGTLDLIGVKKYCALAWSQLSDDEHDLIAPFIDGTNTGPFVFVDGATGDQYTANIQPSPSRTSPKSGTWNISFTVQEV